MRPVTQARFPCLSNFATIHRINAASATKANLANWIERDHLILFRGFLRGSGLAQFSPEPSVLSGAKANCAILCFQILLEVPLDWTIN